MKYQLSVAIVVACCTVGYAFTTSRVSTVCRQAFTPLPKLHSLPLGITSKSTLFSTAEPVIDTNPENASATAKVIVPTENKLLQTLKVGGLFSLWFALNIGYNIYNKKVLNMVPELTWIVALFQLFLGLFYVFPVWALGIRKAPILTNDDIKSLLPVAVLHTLTHLGAVVSLGAGAVSFTHIVKAAEPAVSAALSAVFLKSFLPLPVYLSLLPVMGGVALASLTELSFNWLSFGAAMVSNVASAARGIFGKETMTSPPGKNMDPANLYAVMTVLATLMLAPISFGVEYKSIVPVLTKIASQGQLGVLASQMFLSAMFYYLYNEVAFLTLDKVAPVTHALGNTIKRVVIIITSVIVFGTTMSAQGVAGSTIAILGVLGYSLAKSYFK